MDVAVAVVATAIISAAIAFRIGFVRGVKSGSKWLVRPHTKTTLKKHPLPEEAPPQVVVDAVFVRTNMPNSTSTME